MPESGNVHPAIAVINTVDDAVGANDNLANGWIAELRHDPPISGKSARRLVLLIRNWPRVTARSGESSEM